MIDLHSHIAFNVDDGASSLQESINMIKEAKQAGFTDILLTPHYLENYYDVPTEEIENKLEIIKKEIKNKEIDVELYIGREIYITPNISEKIINKEISTLNNSKYVLVEMPMESRILYLEHELQTLIEAGLIPILAHPERYKIIQKDIKYLEELSEMGVLFQINYGSILGEYGKLPKKTVKKILKKGIVDFIGSDCHREGTLYTKIQVAIKKISKLISEEKLMEITELNARKMLEK